MDMNVPHCRGKKKAQLWAIVISPLSATDSLAKDWGIHLLITVTKLEMPGWFPVFNLNSAYTENVNNSNGDEHSD